MVRRRNGSEKNYGDWNWTTWHLSGAMFGKKGYQVLGVDLSSEYVSQINQKALVSDEPNVTDYLKSSKNFRATTSLKEGLEFSDVCFIVVPTNTVLDIQSYDHNILSNLLSNINSYKVSGKHLVINSTVFPGYIKKTAYSLMKDCDRTTLSYNPEFIAQGDIIKGTINPDMVLIGEGSSTAGDVLQSIYETMCESSPFIARISIESAEITKLAVNCFITTKIAFANLIGDIADESPGADKESILHAIGKDQRIGSRNLKPGYGFGGPCFPRDNRALGNYATLVGIDPLLFRTTDQVNDLHAEFMTNQLIKQNLNEYVFEDVCYKPDCPVPIIENSQKLIIAKKLVEKNKKVKIKAKEKVLEKVKKEFGGIFDYILES
jgi:nucleotide sugar dehydrogenase